MAGSIKLAPLLTEIKVDIENFKNDMEKASAIGTSEAKRISKVMETTAKVGKNFSLHDALPIFDTSDRGRRRCNDKNGG